MTPPSTTSRTLLANARILIEGSRIARVSHGRLGIDPAGTSVVDPGAAGAGDLPYDDAVRLAASVKGYAQVKEAAVAQWRSAVAAADPVRAGNSQV